MNNKILDLIQDRLELGAKKYGKPNMVSDGRDFVKESLEEILDCCVYVCGKEIARWPKGEVIIRPVKIKALGVCHRRQRIDLLGCLCLNCGSGDGAGVSVDLFERNIVKISSASGADSSVTSEIDSDACATANCGKHCYFAVRRGRTIACEYRPKCS